MNSARKERVTVQKSGFTLTELIVAAGIGVIILGVILTVLQAGAGGYGMTSRRIDANVEARSALRTLSDDLSAAIFNESFGALAPAGAWPTNEVWFMALKSRSAQNPDKATGDLCFAYYYTKVTGPLEETREPYARKLYRRLISSADVMKKLKEGENFDDPKQDPTALEDEAVAFNVVQFLVEPLVVMDGGDRVLWKEGDGQPDLVRITLRVTDNETAGVMRKEEDWQDGAALAAQFLGDKDEEGDRLRTFEMTVPFGH